LSFPEIYFASVSLAKTIAKHVLNVHMNNRPSAEASAVGEFDIQKMRGYISYCKA
jgi:DNA replication licensing factor MCM5